MLPVSANTTRLFLHVLAVTVWVGGQLTLAGLLPGLRRISPDAPRKVAQRFSRIAWPAFGVLVVTGIWNILDVEATFDGRYGMTLAVKIAVVTVSGVSAWVHGRSRSPRGLAIGGGLAGLSALGALFLGVLLHG